jgi:hypothetical protein
MRVSDRNRLRKRRIALLLAGNDMRQAEAAARLLNQRSDVNERRALETAIAVCYAGFTQSSVLLTRRGRFEPTNPT